MNFVTIILIALGLSMDAFAVAISQGIALKKNFFLSALKIAFLFGIFQWGMPIIGWFLGKYLAELISNFDHWIASILLFFIGGKMIVEFFSQKKENEKSSESFLQLIILAIATSIDAMAVGLSIAFLGTDIFFPSLIIGITTFILSFFGVFIGKKCCTLFQKKAELIGGIILIGIGIKILIEHVAR